MTAHEISETQRRYQARIEAILSPADLAIYTRYQQRLQDSLSQVTSEPFPLSLEERRVTGLVAQDSEAAVLYKQLQVFLRIEHLPQ